MNFFESFQQSARCIFTDIQLHIAINILFGNSKYYTKNRYFVALVVGNRRQKGLNDHVNGECFFGIS